tara:strand:- start:41440 stop:41886 length:447 start_codon:yes stop_codon:yes gene_type:complete
MASKIVAVAGGSGKLGRAIVDELVANGSYKVFVLGREVRHDLQFSLYPSIDVLQASAEKSQELGAPILAIDYNDADGLVKTLESNNIDTVVSTLGPMSADPELALIAAADKSKVTTRYIPSLWGIRYTPEYVLPPFPLPNLPCPLHPH